MKVLMENKQIIHVVAEILAFVCVIIFISQKTKKMMSHINDLAQRVEDQEDIIQKHEQEIKELKNLIMNIGKPVLSSGSTYNKSGSSVKNQYQKQAQKVPVMPSIIIETVSMAPKPKEVFSSKVEEIDEDVKVDDPISKISEDSDSDMDKELAEELNDLEREHTLD